MHVFLPAILKCRGAKLLQFPVHHRPRKYGLSKYTVARMSLFVYDLVTANIVYLHPIPFYREGKEEKRDYYFTINEQVLSAPIRLLGLSDRIDVVTLYNAYNAIGVCALILLLYFFVLMLSGKRLLAAVTALFVVGGYSIVYNKGLFYSDFNVYGRAMYPPT